MKINSLYDMYFANDESDSFAHVGRSKRDGAKVGSGRYPLGSGKNPNQHDKSTKHEKITSLKNLESVTVNMFGKPKKLKVISAGDNQYDENGNDKEEHFDLNDKELDLLNWLIQNVNIEDYSDEITSYCNHRYWMVGDEKVKDLKDELDINDIIIDVTKVNHKYPYPDISFCGECECDPEHGISIGFKNKKFLGIGNYAWAI